MAVKYINRSYGPNILPSYVIFHQLTKTLNTLAFKSLFPSYPSTQVSPPNSGFIATFRLWPYNKTFFLTCCQSLNNLILWQWNTPAPAEKNSRPPGFLWTGRQSLTFLLPPSAVHTQGWLHHRQQPTICMKQWIAYWGRCWRVHEGKIAFGIIHSYDLLNYYESTTNLTRVIAATTYIHLKQ